MRSSIVLVALLASLGPGPAAHGDPVREPAATALGKVDAAVLAAAQRGRTTFLVMLDRQAELPTSSDAPEEQRATRVYERLTRHARAEQEGLRELLTDRRADFTPYWIVNAVEVTGDRALITEIAERPDV